MKTKHTDISIFDVAKYILELCPSGMTTRKLQKLAFFCQGYYLAIFKSPLFKEEFQAWQYGPVCYELFKTHQGKYTITADQITGDSGNLIAEQKALVRSVTERLGDYSGNQLSDLTHQEDTPWWAVRKKHGLEVTDGSQEVIEKRLLEDYFTALLSKDI